MDRVATVLRVFTRDGAGGNHLGVVDDVRGLNTADMQAIAARLGYSETVFLVPGDAEPLVRIFTPVDELPFAGHPLVGAAWHLASQGRPPASLRCGIGTVHVATTESGTEVRVPWGDTRVEPEAPHAASRLGIEGVVRAWWVFLPKAYLVLELESVSHVASSAPDMKALARHFGTLIWRRSGDQVRARFFAPATGVDEDPATGSAAVALGAALRHVGEGTGRLTIHQGDEIDAPSRIDLTWDDAGAAIAGEVVAVGARTVSL